MTNVAMTLSSRVLVEQAPTDRTAASADATPTDRVVSLARVRPGQAAVITGYAADGPPATLRRLVDLGFGVGEPVDVVRQAPLGDPVVYRVAGYEVALRRTESRLITIASQ